jgi:hypothetical protein
MSLIIAASMVLSLVLVALPSGPAPEPTPFPTLELSPWPSATEGSVPTSPPLTLAPTSEPGLEATEPIIGPSLPTETPALTATITPTLTVTE